VSPSPDRAARSRANGHGAAVVWLTGLPASGKTTIARAVEAALFGRAVQIYVLDGDVLRRGLCRDLGFSPADRTENIRRAGELAALFADAGFVVLVAFISPTAADRHAARHAASGVSFIEVFVDCPLAECQHRDPKNLYQRARAGEIAHLTGVSAPYQAPKNPEVHLHTDTTPVAECAARIIRHLELGGVLPP